MLASADALHHWQSPCNRECFGQAAAACELNHLSSIMGAQAQSAKLIGDAIQKNPAFLTLRKIEVRRYCAEASLRMATLPCYYLAAGQGVYSSMLLAGGT